jgi:hypothetical protein
MLPFVMRYVLFSKEHTAALSSNVMEEIANIDKDSASRA